MSTAPPTLETSPAPAAGAAPPPRPSSPWRPLAIPLFRWLWIASVASNIGTWLQNIGASWLMAILSPHATYVALVQAVTSLPMFLL
ncbi:MAG TPA: MFS transporter, partial [Thermoanaerobaculia bacterium]|nr:MFS transporter [Thermoanaerobaculia bacterium]